MCENQISKQFEIDLNAVLSLLLWFEVETDIIYRRDQIYKFCCEKSVLIRKSFLFTSELMPGSFVRTQVRGLLGLRSGEYTVRDRKPAMARCCMVTGRDACLTAQVVKIGQNFLLYDVMLSKRCESERLYV